jgi:hypothetical protein
MDYLGESGIGAWAYGTPRNRRQQCRNDDAGMMATRCSWAMANGVDVMASDGAGPAATCRAVCHDAFWGYPWHAAAVRRSGPDGTSQAAVVLSRHSCGTAAIACTPRSACRSRKGRRLSPWDGQLYPTLPSVDLAGPGRQGVAGGSVLRRWRRSVFPERQADRREANGPRAAVQGDMFPFRTHPAR